MKFKLILLAFIFCSAAASAQISIDDVLGKAQDLLRSKKPLTVQKGFSPRFFLGSLQINKVGVLGEKLKGIGVLGEIFDSKRIQDVTKLYKTYKTGLVIFKALAAAGTVVTAYSTVRGITDEQKFDDGTVRKLITPALVSVLTGVVTKVITKKASYKAVDIFNGVVTKKIKDILSVEPASQGLGVGLYVQL